MSKIENNRIYYDPYNEIRCDKFALEKLVKESEEKDKTIADLEAKLAESEKRCDKQYSKIYSKIQRDADYIYKLKEELEKKEDAIATWQTMYESVVQTCHNDNEEIERLNKQLETQENTITNLVEDNRASQEWYKKQLAEKEKEIESLKESSDKNIDYLIEFASLIENEKDCNKMLKALGRVREGKKYIVDKEHQDKISFAVAELEKVKVLIHNAVNIDSPEYDLVGLYDAVSNQIKAIKGEK